MTAKLTFKGCSDPPISFKSSGNWDIVYSDV